MKIFLHKLKNSIDRSVSPFNKGGTRGIYLNIKSLLSSLFQREGRYFQCLSLTDGAKLFQRGTINKLLCQFILCLLPFFSITSFAADSPSLCRVSGTKFSKAAVILFSQHTAKPRLYAIHNTSHYPLWLTHEKKNPGASAGWASRIMPNHWSTILVTQPRFDLQCRYQEKSGKMKTLSCQSVIWVCQYSDFDTKNPISGGYWLVENVLFPQLSARMRARGFHVF